MTGPVDESEVVPRRVLPHLAESVEAFRVVVVNGPRQSGKSTLLRQLHSQTGGRLHNLDSDPLFQAARADPTAFVRGKASHVYIDEVQRGGDALVRAVKEAVDEPTNRTRYVLAGSTNFLTARGVSESLAGRVVLMEVWPFSQGERSGTADGFLDRLTIEPASLRVSPEAPLSRLACFQRVVEGGYPEPLRLSSARLRAAWFRSYVQTLTQRDIVEVSGIRRAGELPRLLRYLAGETAHELVRSKLADSVGLERHSVSNYLPLFEQVFLTRELPAWSRNPLGKVTRRPKLHLCDTGLAAHLHGVDAAALDQPVAPLRGQLMETFVHNELVKQRTWSHTEAELYHWRDREGAEVDVVVETSDGRVHGIECKSSSSVRSDDFAWLRKLEAKLGDQFHHGVVFYLGDRALSFGPKMTALPLTSLWA